MHPSRVLLKVCGSGLGTDVPSQTDVGKERPAEFDAVRGPTSFEGAITGNRDEVTTSGSRSGRRR